MPEPRLQLLHSVFIFGITFGAFLNTLQSTQLLCSWDPKHSTINRS